MTDSSRFPGPPGEPARPRRRRWLRASLWSALVLALVLPLAGAFLWFVFLPSRQGTSAALVVVNGLLQSRTNLRLAVASVQPHGTGLRLVEPAILLARDGATDTLFAAREVRLDMDWMALLLRRPQRYIVDAEAARLALAVGEDGRVALPEWRDGGAAKMDTLGGPGGGVVVRLHDASFRLLSPERSVTWWEGGRLELEARWLAGSTVWELSEWNGFLPPLGLQLRQGTARATSGGGVLEVQPIVLETDAGSLAASAVLRGQEWSAEFTARDWPWEFFAEILDQPALDVPGAVQVRGILKGPLGEPRLDLAIHGTWRAEPFSARLLGRAGPDVIVLERAELGWAGTRVRGSGRYGPEGRWSLDARVADLDLSHIQSLAPAIVLPASRLAGPLRVTGEPGRMRVVHETLDGSLGQVAIRGLRGEWTLAGRTATWRLSGGVAGGTVHVEGEWDGRLVRARGTIEDLAWEDLADTHPALADLGGGVASGEVVIEGPPDSLAVRLTSETREAAWGPMTAAVLRVAGEGRVGPRATRFDVVAHGEGLAGGGVRFDSARVRARVHARQIEFHAVEAWRGDTTLTAAGTLALENGGWTLTAPRARLEAGAAALEAAEPLVLRGSSDGFQIQAARFVGSLGELSLAGAWRPRGESHLTLEARHLDPRLLVPGGGASPVAGTVDLTAELSGVRERLALQLRAASDTLWLGGVALEDFRLGVAARQEGARIRVDEFGVESRAGTVRGHLEVDLSAEGVSGPAWRAARDPGRWQGEIAWEGLELASLGPLLPATLELGGTAEGTARLGGSAAARVAATSGRVEGLRWNTVHLDAVRWDAAAEGGRLRIHELVAESEGKEARLEGELPVRLAWSREAREWVPDEPMRLAVTLPEESMRFLPLFLPPVAAADGRVEADLRLEGTPRSPLLWGRLEVKDGMVRPSQREEVYRALHLVVRFEGDRAIVESVEASQGRDGRIRGRGEARLFGEDAGRYRLDLEANGAIARSSGEYAAQFSGRLTIQDGPRVEGILVPLPRITGDVTVESGVILYDFTDPENVVYLTGPRQAPLYVYDLHMEADGRVFWRTPSANVELEADLSVSRDLAGHKLWGTVESLRGHFFFLENKFEMERGELTFDRAESFDAKLDAEAVATVTRLDESKYEKEEVHLELHGRMREPEVRLWSSSGLAEKDIFALLTFGRFGVGQQELLAKSDQRVLVGVTGTQYLMRQLSREFPEISSFLTSVQLGTTAATGGGGAERLYTTVGVNSYVTPELRLGYSQVLGGSGEVVQGELMLWDISAEYRIGRLLYLTGEVVERRVGSSLGSGTFQNQVEYNLDVRARLDY